MTAITPIPDDDPLAIPRALRRTRGDHAAEWAGRTVTETAGAAPPGRAREEDAATAAFRAEVEAEKQARSRARIEKMKARFAEDKIDRTGQRWDSRKNRWVDDRPPTMPTTEEVRAMGLNLELEEKDFAVMNGGDLVKWYNAACELAGKHRMASYRPVKKFEDKATAAKRCSFLAHSLRAAVRAGEGAGPAGGNTGVTGHCRVCGALSGSCSHTKAPPEGANKELYKPDEKEEDLRPPFLKDKTDGPAATAAEQQPSKTEGEKTMAKRAKKEKANGEGGYRSKGRPAKTVAEFKPVRADTNRAIVLKMAAQKSTANLDVIAKEIDIPVNFKDKPGAYVIQHLSTLHRDNGIGFDVDAKGNIELKFPGSKTVKDAIVQKAAE